MYLHKIMKTVTLKFSFISKIVSSILKLKQKDTGMKFEGNKTDGFLQNLRLKCVKNVT